MTWIEQAHEEEEVWQEEIWPEENQGSIDIVSMEKQSLDQRKKHNHENITKVKRLVFRTAHESDQDVEEWQDGS